MMGAITRDVGLGNAVAGGIDGGSARPGASVLGGVRVPVGSVLRTSDPDEATATIAERYAPNRIAVKRGGDFCFRMRNNELPGLALGYVAVGTGVQIASPNPNCYTVCTTTAGSVQVTSGRESLLVSDTSAVIVCPTEPAFFEDWSPDALLVTVRLARDDMEELLATMLGRQLSGSINFEYRLDLAGTQGGSFLRALKFLRSELQHPDGMASDPVMAESLSRMVMTSLLRDHVHNHSDELRAPDARVAMGPVGRAIELIESQPDQVVSVADIASAANLSIRALEAGFRQRVGMAPMTYLREVRLARVHAELKSSEPLETTAARVGRRWGFNHYGRFVSAYRAKYGTTPGSVLRER